MLVSNVLKMKRNFQGLYSKVASAKSSIGIALLVCLVSFFSLPILPAQAEGFSVLKNHTTEKVAPFYSGKNTNKVTDKKEFTPFYSHQGYIARTSENAAKAQQMNDDYIKSGKRAAEVIPKDLGTGSRQKNPVNMLKRAGEELGNDIPKRVLGDNNYDRSPIEAELARNKAARGDYGS
jgi:hypothetical protein